ASASSIPVSTSRITRITLAAWRPKGDFKGGFAPFNPRRDLEGRHDFGREAIQLLQDDAFVGAHHLPHLDLLQARIHLLHRLKALDQSLRWTDDPGTGADRFFERR